MNLSINYDAESIFTKKLCSPALWTNDFQKAKMKSVSKAKVPVAYRISCSHSHGLEDLLFTFTWLGRSLVHVHKAWRISCSCSCGLEGLLFKFTWLGGSFLYAHVARRISCPCSCGLEDLLFSLEPYMK